MSTQQKKHVQKYLNEGENGSRSSKSSKVSAKQAFQGLNIDKRKQFGNAAEIERPSLVKKENSTFSQGGHVERSSYTVPKSSKKPAQKPDFDRNMKSITKKYLEYKEQDMKKYEEERAKALQEEMDRKMQKEMQMAQEEQEKRQALLEEIRQKDKDRKISWNFNEKIYHIMRDPTTDQIHEKNTELQFQKGKVKQIQYSEGDTTALEGETPKYHLSTTNQLELTDKMSGEQNRSLYGQVRPSYFGEVQTSPILDTPEVKIVNSAGQDITMRKGNGGKVRLEKDHSKGEVSQWESSLRKIPGSEEIKRTSSSGVSTSATPAGEQTFAQELFSYVDEVKFRNIRKTFEYYSTLGRSDNPKTMDSSQLQSMLKNNSLYFPGFNAQKADILFHKGNSKKFITFDQFCRILIECAELKYQERAELTTKQKVALYLKEFVFVRQKNAYKVKTDTYADWLIELESKKMVQILKSWKPTFKADFNSFATRSIVDKEPVMDAKTMFKYCNSRDIIPDLLNRADCLTLFKECQRASKADIHKEVLTFSEFMEFISFIGVYYFTKNSQHYPKLTSFEKKVSAMFKWLQKRIK